MIEICEPFNNIDILTEEIYQYTTFENVIKVENQLNKWIIEVDKNIKSSNISYYLIIDTLYHDAFFHWVAECAIYLPFFIRLKNKYPTLKLYLKEFKNFKKLFCDYFDIKQHDIVYNLDNSNVCIFPMPISALNIVELNENWKLHVDYFIWKLTSKYIDNQKNIQSIFLPRQSKENYKNNDRRYNTIDISNNIEKSNNSVILNTDDIIDLNEQIKLVNSSSNVILTAGSAYFVNGLFCKNSHIILLDDSFNMPQINGYMKLKHIHNTICENNKVFFIPKHNGNVFYYNDITNYLQL